MARRLKPSPHPTGRRIYRGVDPRPGRAGEEMRNRTPALDAKDSDRSFTIVGSDTHEHLVAAWVPSLIDARQYDLVERIHRKAFLSRVLLVSLASGLVNTSPVRRMLICFPGHPLGKQRHRSCASLHQSNQPCQGAAFVHSAAPASVLPPLLQCIKATCL